MITFKEEKLGETLLKEILPMAEAHQEEVIPEEIRRPIDIKFGLYSALQEKGFLKTFTVRSDSKVIGYAIFHVSEDMKSKGKWLAIQDVVYIEPRHRPKHGLSFMRFVDEQLEKGGVDYIYQNASLTKDIGPILEWLGYKATQKIYARRVKNG